MYTGKHELKQYIGKHELKTEYKVWRVRGAAGPAETITAYSLPEVKQLVQGCWDWEVTDSMGELVPDKIILYS